MESSGQESHAGSDAQGQESSPLLTVIPFQPTPEAIDETEVHTEGEIHLEDKVAVGEEIHPSQNGTEASGDLPKPPLISPATVNAPVTESHPSEDHPSPNTVSTPPHDPSKQKLDASATQAKNASQADQVVRQTPYVVVNDSGAAVTDSGKNQPVSVEPQPNAALPQQDSVVRRAFHAYLGAVSSNGKPETPKPDSVLLEEVPQDHSASTQIAYYGRALGNSEDIGARVRWAFPHGQQPGDEAGEQFNELWADHHGPQPDHVVAKLPQAAVVDLQLANGQSAGPMAAGVQAHSGSGPTSPPSNASFVSQPPPAMPTSYPAEHSMRLMTRSVVLDLTQPDLGHVNVRVAMMNDVVHTHMSADRPEVGQYLMNGQDRFQAVLQTNGLEMGQFRVDIDRQGAGRSFQQGQFQEQGHAWNQGSHGMEHEHGRDGRDESRGSLHGLLNLVA
ncbi:MAG: flagellar hook-length control protein FliK [Nitrospira sp.]